MPAIDVIVRCKDSPVVRSLSLSESIEIICETGSVSLIETVSQTPMRAQKGHVVARKRINPTGIKVALPTRYNLFIFSVKSVNHPKGSARSTFTALLMLRIKPISIEVAPKRSMKMDQYSPPPRGSIPGGPLPPPSLPIVSLIKKTL